MHERGPRAGGRCLISLFPVLVKWWQSPIEPMPHVAKPPQKVWEWWHEQAQISLIPPCGGYKCRVECFPLSFQKGCCILPDTRMYTPQKGEPPSHGVRTEGFPGSGMYSVKTSKVPGKPAHHSPRNWGPADSRIQTGMSTLHFPSSVHWAELLPFR